MSRWAGLVLGGDSVCDSDLALSAEYNLTKSQCGGKSVRSPLQTDVDGLIFKMGLKTKKD